MDHNIENKIQEDIKEVIGGDMRGNREGRGDVVEVKDKERGVICGPEPIKVVIHQFSVTRPSGEGSSNYKKYRRDENIEK